MIILHCFVLSLQIEVHYEGGVWAGHLEEYDHNIVVVKVFSGLDVYLPVDRVGCSLSGMGIAIWGDVSGTLLAASLDLSSESFAEVPIFSFLFSFSICFLYYELNCNIL